MTIKDEIIRKEIIEIEVSTKNIIKGIIAILEEHSYEIYTESPYLESSDNGDCVEVRLEGGECIALREVFNEAFKNELLEYLKENAKENK